MTPHTYSNAAVLNIGLVANHVMTHILHPASASSNCFHLPFKIDLPNKPTGHKANCESCQFLFFSKSDDGEQAELST